MKHDAFVRMSPGTRVLTLTLRGSAAVTFCEFSCGVDGVQLRQLGSAEFLTAVSDMVPEDAAFKDGAQTMSQPLTRQCLSPRDAEVLEFIAKGYTYKEITGQLCIAYSSVRTYIARIYEKLGVKSRAQAMASYHTGAGKAAR
jgi:DNA-binding NarL/FixJ family response regulator